MANAVYRYPLSSQETCQNALEVALCTDPPHQPKSCLSHLIQHPGLCTVLGVVVCTIAVAAIVGLVLLGMGILSIYNPLVYVLLGLVCVSLLIMGFTLVYQGAFHKLPDTPEEIFKRLQKRIGLLREAMAKVDEKIQQTPDMENDTKMCLRVYKDSMHLESIMLRWQCEHVRVCSLHGVP